MHTYNIISYLDWTHWTFIKPSSVSGESPTISCFSLDDFIFQWRIPPPKCPFFMADAALYQGPLLADLALGEGIERLGGRSINQ